MKSSPPREEINPPKFYRQGPAVIDVEDRITAGGSRLPAGWLQLATELVEQFTRRGQHFTSADLRRAGLPAPVHANHWGSLFAHLQAKNLVRRVGLRVERQPSRGSRPVTVWAGIEHQDAK
jgi:hypothetical protein